MIRATSLYGRYTSIIGEFSPVLVGKPVSAEHAKSFRLRMHYERNNYGLCENQIIKNIALIEDMPTLIVHNCLDIVTPAGQAWDLHFGLKKSKMVIVPDYGHDSFFVE